MISNIIAIIGLGLSFAVGLAGIIQTEKQIRLSNKQFIFSERIKVYLLLCDIYKCKNDTKILLHNDNASKATKADYIALWLTNSVTLEPLFRELQRPLKNVTARQEYNSKINELNKTGKSAEFLFKQQGNEISQAIQAYIELISSLHRYQVNSPAP